MELNGNLLSNEFYKFDEHNTINKLTESDYKQIINTNKSIKIQFPYGINGMMSDICEYTVDEISHETYDS